MDQSMNVKYLVVYNQLVKTLVAMFSCESVWAEALISANSVNTRGTILTWFRY